MSSLRRIIQFYIYVTLLCVVLYVVSYRKLADLVASEHAGQLPLNTSQKLQRIKNLNEKEIVCKLPQLDPFHEDIKRFIKNTTIPPKCHVKYPEVFKLGLNSTVVRESNTTEWKDCCYKIISRKSNTSQRLKVDDKTRYSDKCVPMPETVTQIPPEIEFIGIYCIIPERQSVALNISKSSKSKRLIDGFAFIPAKAEPEKINHTASPAVNDSNHDTKLSVVILGIDGVSRMNLFRIMPRVHNFLIHNLSAINMEVYVKIGDNTFPNLFAALTAMNSSSVQQSCGKNKFYDDCPFLWKDFAGQGYKTAFTEDAPTMGVFNYNKHGFVLPPVDYYVRPLLNVLNARLGTDRRANANLCYGPRLSIEVLLNHMKKMAIAMNLRNQRYFQLIWATSLTHDLLTLGQLGENATLETLQWFQEEDHLNKTLLIVMSDHGLRFGGFRKTKQGHIEDNLPFLYFVLPDWFKRKYPSAIENMKKNTNRLTTPFDLHETLLDILNPTNLEKSEISQRNEELDSQRLKNEVPRGISMFLPSPPERTCAMAAIPEHYCACHQTESLEPQSFLAQQAANFALYHLNSLLSKFTDCAFLTLIKVSSAEASALTLETDDDDDSEESAAEEQVVKISFATSPGDAEFEGTIIRSLRHRKTENWTVSDVSRVNLYGKQSHCIHEKSVEKYCYCNDLLQK